MVFRECSKKVSIRPVVLNKFRELSEYEKKHKKNITHKCLDVFINDLLQSTLEKYERLNEYAIVLSVHGYNDGKITLRDVNPSRKTNYLDFNVEDSELMYVKDNKIGCVYCHFVLAILKVA
jgi:S-adenosylhomocysteine hydrolase